MAAIVGSRQEARTVDFSPYGYDERQFCSPGFDLPVGRLSRGVHGEYPEYHTSGDDLSFVRPCNLVASLELLVEALDALEANHRYRNAAPYGEPQLGRRGLYSATGGAVTSRSVEMAYLWVLSGADGQHDLCDIAATSGLPLASVIDAAQKLESIGLLTR
jgi:aminopeptidase-like protein